jgi:enoyl-CoA hydratase/carnithine racemase
MNEGSVHLSIESGVATVWFDRPQARNAMTWAMYGQLMTICRQLQGDASVRVAILRGAGGEAFIAGTDIGQFQGFGTGDKGAEDGVAYERQIDACLALLEGLPMPTVAVVEGWCVGGGLAIATGCDFRIATTTARFGVPIAKTLGNCLSIANLARLTAAFGAQRVKRMLMLADILSTDEALACGYLQEVCAPTGIDAATSKLVQRLAALASITQSVSKEGLRRLTAHGLPDGEDLIRRSYGSDDFREGVQAFVAKRPPVWGGA